MRKLFGIVLISILIFVISGFSQVHRGKSFAVGAIYTENAYGGYGEYLWTTGDWDLSFRLGLLSAESERAFEDEGWIGIGNFYGHIPTGLKWLSFRFGIGGFYQSFEWKTLSSSGTINDFSINGGLVLDVRITDFLGAGIEGWIIADYDSRLNSDLEPEIGERYMRFAPAATITFFF